MELRGAAAAAVVAAAVAAAGVADDEANEEDAGPGVLGDWTCTSSVAVDTGSVT